MIAVNKQTMKFWGTSCKRIIKKVNNKVFINFFMYTIFVHLFLLLFIDTGFLFLLHSPKTPIQPRPVHPHPKNFGIK